jgi:hypothetical protein
VPVAGGNGRRGRFGTRAADRDVLRAATGRTPRGG